MASKELIDRLLLRLDLVYRTKKPIRALEELSAVFMSDFRNVTDDEFQKAIDWHRRESTFFPTPKELLDRVGMLRRQAEAKIKYIPPTPLTQAQIEENKRRCREIKSKLSKKWQI